MEVVRYAPLGYGQLSTSLSGAVKLGSAFENGLPVGADSVLLQADTHDVRWTDDGTTPTSSVGMILKSGDAPFLYTGAIENLQFIESASGAVLDFSLYRIVG